MKTIYLAGGMREDWRQELKTFFSQAPVRFFDPTLHGLRDPALYTYWDMEAIRRCDIVLGYFEETNPSGIGLACEIGYAMGLGKTVILVSEQPENKYFAFVENTGAIVAEDMKAAKALLVSILSYLS